MRFNTGLALIFISFCPTVFGQVKELNNTEMTEAYIKDGAIVVKQRVKQQTKEPTPIKANLTVGPGEPAVTQAEQVQEQDRQNISQNERLERELSNSSDQQQLQQFELNQLSSNVSLQSMQSSTALAQQSRAHEIVRQGLGLNNDVQITTDLMAQYLQTFTGTYVTPNGSQQAITDQGYQFSTPNLNGQLDTAIYPIGETMSVEVTDQQVIWNLLFPQKP